MRKYIARGIGYPLQDFVRRTTILKTLNLLRESQFWDKNKLYDYRLMKLKNLIDYAFFNVPYYQNLFNSIKLKPNDIQTISDIKKIPILTKDVVRRENLNLVSKNYNMRYVLKGKTGGTTGTPIITFSDPFSRSFTWASYYRWYDWMGISMYDKTATLWGSKTVLTNSLKGRTKDLIINFLQNNIEINSFEMNERTLPGIYQRINNFQPVLLKGYLSSLLYLGKYLEFVGDHSIRAKGLSTTTETLLPHNRHYLEKIFNCPVYDQYGCGEVSSIAFECSKHNGLHINQEHVIVEILDEDGSDLVGQTGRLIATDLDDYVMPFIRYENGDSAIYSTIQCKCGINQPLLTSIAGRTSDIIILANGNRVHGVFFTDILYELNILSDKIQKFQVYQDIPGNIEFRFESTVQLESGLKTSLSKSLLKFFNNVNIIYVNRLQHEENGKFRYIKTTIPQ